MPADYRGPGLRKTRCESNHLCSYGTNQWLIADQKVSANLLPMLKQNIPMVTVGKPRPLTPLTVPASSKAVIISSSDNAPRITSRARVAVRVQWSF